MSAELTRTRTAGKRDDQGISPVATSQPGVIPDEARAAAPTCVVERISSPDALQRLAPAWRELLGRSRANTLFLSWEWAASWTECFLRQNRQLFVVCVRYKGELIAIAPWYIETAKRGVLMVREVRFVGSPESGADYLDVILLEGKERMATEAIYEFLFAHARNEWDQLVITDIPGESLFLLHFHNVLDKQGKFAELRRHAYLPQMSLPATFDAYLASLSNHRRVQFRNNMRRLGRNGEFAHVLFDEERVQAGLDRFLALYEARSGYDDGARLVRFLKHLLGHQAAHDWIQVHILAVAGRDIIAIIFLNLGGRLFALKMVSDKTWNPRISIGTVMYGLSIKRAIESGISHFDFLKGDEPYKFHWARDGRLTLSLTLAQRRWRPLALLVFRQAKYIAKAFLR